MKRSPWIAACALAVLLMPSDAAAAKPERCLVVNTTSGGAFRELQAAVDTAAAGDALKLKGTCTNTARGGIGIGKDLTITGQSNNGFGPATVAYVPELFTRSAVIRIDAGAAVTLTGLTITGGSGSFDGGGISVRGTLVLNDGLVSGNSALGGGGIAVEESGRATLNRTRLEGNFGVFGGGGIQNRGILVVNGGAIIGNQSQFEGGAIVTVGGAATITATVISGNRGGSGGGIANLGGTVAIEKSAITTNTAGRGGGIFTWDGSIAITNTTVTGNTACEGGGIYNIGSALTVANSVLTPNTETCSPAGASAPER